jgi:trehalose-6-phosphate synthase
LKAIFYPKSNLPNPVNKFKLLISQVLGFASKGHEFAPGDDVRLLSVRLIASLVLGITLVSLLSSYYQVRSEKQNLRRDLEHRGEVLAESLTGNIEPALEKSNRKELQRIVARFGNREHLEGIGIYDPQGQPIAITPGLTERMAGHTAPVSKAEGANHGYGEFIHEGDLSIHVYVMPLHVKDQVAGAVAIVQDSSYINAQSVSVWRGTFLRVLLQGVVIVFVTLLIVRLSIVGPLARAAQWMKALRTGKGSARPPDLDLLYPLAREMKTFAASLTAARFAAVKEAQLREAGDSVWTAERLGVHVRAKLESSRLFVVSNREPYLHIHGGKEIQVMVPASGLVTALEPILRACDGTWVAHGSGDADRETVDKNDCLRVPPEEPRYTLRRVWLSKEEEEGYYYGFANEGLWPLCHIAHTRPLFRASDWEHYKQVNQLFADAVLEEMADVENPVLLAQDYHFALLPRMVKKARPDARVAIFWHIPWPNPEAFGICPWQKELLDGLLGADLIGFHIQSHCNNFLQTVDRALESRIDWEHFSVNREEHRTVVKPFPISVDFAEAPVQLESENTAYEERVTLLRELGVEASLLGVGVDRVDYTKGILERFLAIEWLLEKYPEYRENFTFIQIGAPSRTHIKRYHDLLGEVEAEAERINWRWQTSKWKPIVFLKRQHSHREIDRYYRTADLCVVSSLHDGMNLVAKEFLAARHDEQGVLVLSCFTGAARELADALIVNPYNIQQTAEAIRFGLEMDLDERRVRMQRMRKVVKEHNIYRWAGNLISDLSDVRLDTPVDAKLRGIEARAGA